MRILLSATAAFMLAASGTFALAETPPAGNPPPATAAQEEARPAAPTTPGDNTPGSPQAEAAPAADNQAVAPSRPPVYLSMDFTDVDLPVLIKFISEQSKSYNFV